MAVEVVAEFSASVADVADPKLTSVPATVQFQNMVSFHPWLGMGKTPGRTYGKALGTKLRKLDDLPRGARLALEKRTPEIFDLASWTKPRIDFAEYMQHALYAPGLGYYAAGSTQFGEAGDFVTAPELSPLFAATVAAATSGLIAWMTQTTSNASLGFARHSVASALRHIHDASPATGKSNVSKPPAAGTRRAIVTVSSGTR